MAEHSNASDYANANAAVAGGSATQHQIDLVSKAAKQAGSAGNAAREAQKDAGKR